jgi:uncharacterized protein (DUF885 family)
MLKTLRVVCPSIFFMRGSADYAPCLNREYEHAETLYCGMGLKVGCMSMNCHATRLGAAFMLLTAVTCQPLRAQPQSEIHDRLMKLAQKITYASARLHPMEATSLGISGYDGDLETPTEASRAAYADQLQQWREQLHRIEAQLNPAAELVDRDDARLLEAELARRWAELTDRQQDRKDYSKSGNDVVHAIYTQFQNLPVVGREGATQEDVNNAWRDIVSRLSKLPAYVAAAQKLVTMPCHLYGIIGSEELDGAPEFLNGPLTAAAAIQMGKETRVYRRFARARDQAVAVLAELKTYIDMHADSWPENYSLGPDAYRRMLQEQQLIPFEARDIEQIGYDTLAHGSVELAWLKALSQSTATPLGAASGGGLAPEGAALPGYYRERIAQLREFVTGRQMVTIPDWLGQMQVVETPAFMLPVQPTAAMAPPRLFSRSTTGIYYVPPVHSLQAAASRLEMNKDFDRDRILFTAAHEAMPGHFLQLSIARRHPNFIRKTGDSAAFIEGWAFYGQELFLRLGLYGADLDARLDVAEWERVDGAAAVADTKLASGEWTFQQTVDFFGAHTNFSRGAVLGAVSLMARNPGYVVAYAVGRRQIEDLLAEYALRMGDRASLHDFHDRLLSYGSTPVAVLGPELLADLNKSASEVRAAALY